MSAARFLLPKAQTGQTSMMSRSRYRIPTSTPTSVSLCTPRTPTSPRVALTVRTEFNGNDSISEQSILTTDGRLIESCEILNRRRSQRFRKATSRAVGRTTAIAVAYRTAQMGGFPPLKSAQYKVPAATRGRKQRPSSRYLRLMYAWRGSTYQVISRIGFHAILSLKGPRTPVGPRQTTLQTLPAKPVPTLLTSETSTSMAGFWPRRQLPKSRRPSPLHPVSRP